MLRALPHVRVQGPARARPRPRQGRHHAPRRSWPRTSREAADVIDKVLGLGRRQRGQQRRPGRRRALRRVRLRRRGHHHEALHARARGAAPARIRKRSCHITIIVARMDDERTRARCAPRATPDGRVALASRRGVAPPRRPAEPRAPPRGRPRGGGRSTAEEAAAERPRPPRASGRSRPVEDDVEPREGAAEDAVRPARTTREAGAGRRRGAEAPRTTPTTASEEHED